MNNVVRRVVTTWFSTTNWNMTTHLSCYPCGHMAHVKKNKKKSVSFMSHSPFFTLLDEDVHLIPDPIGRDDLERSRCVLRENHFAHLFRHPEGDDDLLRHFLYLHFSLQRDFSHLTGVGEDEEIDDSADGRHIVSY